MEENDSPWKAALEHYLEPFLALFFPQIHADIDWPRGHEWLNHELRKIKRKDKVGRRDADVLVKVWHKDGGERWLLIHIEVQARRESGFPRRMFEYHYRILNQYKKEVCSLAIFADKGRLWKPHLYQRNLWGCRLRFEFPFVKLTDWLPRLPELEAERNPFALVVAAHLRGEQTRGNASERLTQRLRLVRGLLERGLSRKDIERLFDLIDWFMALPPPEDTVFWDEIQRYETENKMPHMTSIERRGLERGRAEGLREGLLEAIELGLKLRFGSEGLQCLPPIQTLMDIDRLRRIKKSIETASTLDDIRQLAMGQGEQDAAHNQH
jgi:DNA-binding transcriptional MerR regulator